MYSEITFPGLGIAVNPDPTALTLGSIHIQWYGVLIALGFILAVFYCNRRAKQFGITEDQLLTMLICAVPASIVCARAYYCIFNWSAYADDPISCLYIWEGGIAIYGAILGAVAAVVIYCLCAKVNLGAMLDIGGLGLPIGQAIGRWGNFMNREAHGVVTDSFLRMGLADKNGVVTYYHPTFLYESLWNALGFVLLHFYSKKRKYDGEVFTLYVAWYGLGRCAIEGLRTDSLWIFDTGIRASQLLGGVSCLVALGLWIWKRWIKKPTGEKLYVNRVNAEKENS